MGMRCVDFQCWDRSMHFGNVVGYCTDGEDDYDTKEMVNFIARPLEMGELNYDGKVNR